jgi:Skp family chaperone for outer membrane proteins
MRQVRFADLDNQFKAEFAVKRAEAIDSLMAKVSEAITAEAKAQKLNIVFDADIVLFADTDITDAVIKRLNAGQAEADEGQEGGGDQGGQ